MANILIVEDDASALDMLRRALEGEGHTVVVAGDGREAQAHLSATDLVITDVSMPDVDGITLVTGALKTRPDLPIIVMSGLPGELDRAKALGAKNLHTVSKPFTLDAMRGQVRAALSS